MILLTAVPCSSFVVVTKPQTWKTKVTTTFFTYFSRAHTFDWTMRDFSQLIPFQHSGADLPKMALSSSLFPSHSAVGVPCGYLRISITWTCPELTSLHMGRTFLLLTYCLIKPSSSLSENPNSSGSTAPSLHPVCRHFLLNKCSALARELSG